MKANVPLAITFSNAATIETLDNFRYFLKFKTF